MLLDRPLFGEEATGTLARVLAYRRTKNWGQAARLPGSSCPPSPNQSLQRKRYATAVSAWHALSDTLREFYTLHKPLNLSGYNLFLRLYLTPTIAYLGYCIFGVHWFQLAPGPDQPVETDYELFFPTAPDEFPVMRQGADSPQAWITNRIYDTITNIQEYIITNKEKIET